MTTKLWKCLACSVAREAGLEQCPECPSTKHGEIAVPKVTTAGPSNRHEDAEPVVEAVPEPEADQGSSEVPEAVQEPAEPAVEAGQDKATDNPVVEE